MKTYHCSVVEICGCGILIEGASGSGKTSLAMGLIERAEARGLQLGFVCDDRAKLKAKSNQIIARPPKTLAGKLEVRGFGIVEMANLPETRIGLIISLVADETVERMPDPSNKELEGVLLPSIEVPQRHEAGAVRITFAWLQNNGFMSNT